MRHLVYLLLAANLVYFGWNLYSDGRTAEVPPALPPLPASAARLVTLQERQQQSATADEGEASRVLDSLTMTQPPGSGTPVCQTLGPFHTVEDMHAIAGKLDELGLQPRQRVTEERKENGYWVYLPAMERARALEIAQQLEAHKVSDYYIGKDNFMSLGTFTDIARARNRLQQMQALGLNANLGARYARENTYWLDFQDGDRAAQVLEEVLGANPDLQLLTPACL